MDTSNNTPDLGAAPDSVRAKGCLLGQLAGDALGSVVEFMSPEDIRRQDPYGVRRLADGGHEIRLADDRQTAPKWRWPECWWNRSLSRRSVRTNESEVTSTAF